MNRAISNKRTVLSELLGYIDINNRVIRDSFSLTALKPLNHYLDLIMKQNIDLLIANKDLAIAKQNKREIESFAYPEINLVASYNFNRSQNQAERL